MCDETGNAEDMTVILSFSSSNSILQCRFVTNKQKRTHACRPWCKNERQRRRCWLTPNPNSSAAFSSATQTRCSAGAHRRSWLWRLYYWSKTRKKELQMYTLFNAEQTGGETTNQDQCKDCRFKRKKLKFKNIKHFWENIVTTVRRIRGKMTAEMEPTIYTGVTITSITSCCHHVRVVNRLRPSNT